jgi:hypothetical protein
MMDTVLEQLDWRMVYSPVSFKKNLALSAKAALMAFNVSRGPFASQQMSPRLIIPLMQLGR